MHPYNAQQREDAWANRLDRVATLLAERPYATRAMVRLVLRSTVMRRRDSDELMDRLEADDRFESYDHGPYTYWRLVDESE